MQARFSSYVRRHHVALVVLFLTLCGGTAYGLDGENTVESDDIAVGEVGTADVLDSDVRSGDIANDTLVEGGLTNSDLAPASVTSQEVATNGVRTADVRDDWLAAGGLSAADLGAASVGASELGDGPWAGSEIDEATLGTVPQATLAGQGRSAANHNDCLSPENADWESCAHVLLTPPRTARLLVTAAGRLTGSAWYSGRCRIRIPAYVSNGSLTGPYQSGAAQIKYYNFLWTSVIGPYPPGSMQVILECRSDYQYRAIWDDMQLSVVALSG